MNTDLKRSNTSLCGLYDYIKCIFSLIKLIILLDRHWARGVSRLTFILCVLHVYLEIILA